MIPGAVRMERVHWFQRGGVVKDEEGAEVPEWGGQDESSRSLCRPDSDTAREKRCTMASLERNKFKKIRKRNGEEDAELRVCVWGGAWGGESIILETSITTTIAAITLE